MKTLLFELSVSNFDKCLLFLEWELEEQVCTNFFGWCIFFASCQGWLYWGQRGVEGHPAPFWEWQLHCGQRLLNVAIQISSHHPFRSSVPDSLASLQTRFWQKRRLQLRVEMIFARNERKKQENSWLPFITGWGKKHLFLRTLSWPQPILTMKSVFSFFFFFSVLRKEEWLSP